MNFFRKYWRYAALLLCILLLSTYIRYTMRLQTLHKAIVSGNAGMVRQLLREGMNPNADLDSSPFVCRPALMLACMSGDAEVVKALLDAGAKVGRDDNCDQSPLHQAIATGSDDVVRLLLRNGADLTEVPWAVAEAARAGNTELVDLLLSYGADPMTPAPWGGTALHGAARHGLVSLVRRLLRMGLDPDAQNVMEETPLSLAIEEREFETARILLGARDAGSPLPSAVRKAARQVADQYNDERFVELVGLGQ